jgi:hypothetical protein
MRKIESIIDSIIKKSWFFSAFLFLGLIIIGKVDNKKDFFALLILCLILWLLDILLLKKGITFLLTKLLNHYKRCVHYLEKKK